MRILNKNTITATVIIISGIFISSCSSPIEVEETTVLQKIVITNEDTTDGSQKTEGEPHSGKYFSHTDSSNAYGSTAVYMVPDSLIQKDIRVKVNMWVRQGDFNDKNQFAISLEAPDKSIIQWFQIVTVNHVKETRKWINVNDSITIPGNLVNKTGLLIKMFPYNPEGTSYMDNDDIEISVLKVEKKIID